MRTRLTMMAKFIPLLWLALFPLAHADAPVQEWIYVTVESPSGAKAWVMTKAGPVEFSAVTDFDAVTYDFTGVEDRGKFNLLKECFGRSTITPGELGELFGSNAVISYAYAYLTEGPPVHSMADINDALLSGRLKQNRVTIRLTSE